MGTRIILFVGFCSLVVFFLTLGGYKKLFQQENPLNADQISMAKAVWESKQMAESQGATAAPVEKKAADENDPVIQAGKAVYESNNCAACHGAMGEGNAEVQGPMLAAQHTWYVIDQMNQMQKGTRAHVTDGTELASLSDQEIKEVAKYIQFLRVQ